MCISGIIQSVIPAFDFLGETITNVLSGDQTIGQALDLMASKITEKASALIPKGAEMIGKLMQGVGQALPQMINTGIKVMLNLVQGIGTAMPQLIVKGLQAITNVINGLTKGQPALASKAVSVAGKIILAFVKALPQILRAGVNLMVALLKGMISGWRAIPSAIASRARSIPQAIRSGVGNLFSIGSDLIAGLWNGIKAKFDSVIGRVSAMASKLPTAVKKVLGIGSPSKVFRQLGVWTGEGFALGIESMTKAVELASLNLVSIPSAQAMSMGIDSEYEYGASFEISVPLFVNGREFAKATAGDMSSAINQLDSRAQRMRGIR